MKFICSYAYDVPAFADFIVEAENAREAKKKIKKALADGDFIGVECDVNLENQESGNRVFIQGQADEADCASYPTMDQLIKEDAD